MDAWLFKTFTHEMFRMYTAAPSVAQARDRTYVRVHMQKSGITQPDDSGASTSEVKSGW